MSQISPPIRILLVAAVGFLAVYMLFLRPKPRRPSRRRAPAADHRSREGPGRRDRPASPARPSRRPPSAGRRRPRRPRRRAARPPAGRRRRRRRRHRRRAPSPPPAAAAAGRRRRGAQGDARRPAEGDPRAVASTRCSCCSSRTTARADDRAVRRALTKVDRYGGRVFVARAPIKTVARYQADRPRRRRRAVADRRGRRPQPARPRRSSATSTTTTIDQAVVDALRASGGSLLKDPYLRQVDSVCASAEPQVKALPAARRRGRASPRTSTVSRRSPSTWRRRPPRSSRAQEHTALPQGASAGYSATPSASWHAGQPTSSRTRPTASTRQRDGGRASALDKKFVRQARRARPALLRLLGRRA